LAAKAGAVQSVIRRRTDKIRFIRTSRGDEGSDKLRSVEEMMARD
jgi:hypothetical protein